MNSNYDIYIVGAGVKGYVQLTREAEDVIRKCSTVYLVNTQAELTQYLVEKLACNVIDIGNEYSEMGYRGDTYRRMASRVLENTGKGLPPVCFLTSGHPTMLVTPTQILLAEAASKNLRVKVIPGVSALDNIFADIGFDPGPRGFQSYEATDLLLRGVNLNSEVPLFIWQVGSIGTFLYSSRKSKPEQFVDFKNYLGRYYTSDHPCFLLRSSTFPFTKSECIGLTIGTLEDLGSKLTLMHILFIPPNFSSTSYDDTLLQKARSTEFLTSVTEDRSPATVAPPDRAQLVLNIIERASRDCEFCETLVRDPNAALADERLNDYEKELFVNANETAIYQYLGDSIYPFARRYGNYDNDVASATKWLFETKIIG
jgi:precorrin-3B methylase